MARKWSAKASGLAPNCIQVELTQGCNLGCDFCGIHAVGYQKMKRGADLMTVETAVSLAHQVRDAGWNPRIEFAMHGEPTLHPDRALIVDAFRRALPKSYIMMTSNGGGLLKDTEAAVDALFNAGLNTLALDNYQTVSIVPKIVERLCGMTVEELHTNAPLHAPDGTVIRVYPQDPEGNPHTRHKGRLLSIVRDISVATDGTHAKLNNHAGSAAPLNDEGAGKRCAKPFRELSVRWDGNVAICCNDWPGTYRCGNVVTDGLLAVWHSDAMEAARSMLYAGRREMVPCLGCDATSYRVGLLPDKLGKETVAAPTRETFAQIEKALADGPYTSAVRPPLRL